MNPDYPQQGKIHTSLRHPYEDHGLMRESAKALE
jgi:hypothetical protein